MLVLDRIYHSLEQWNAMQASWMESRFILVLLVPSLVCLSYDIWLAGWLNGWLVVWLGWMTACWLAGWLGDLVDGCWLDNLLAGWLTGWMAG